MQASRMARPSVGVVFDADMSGLDDALTLALLYGLEQKSDARVVGLSTTQSNLEAAAFMDAFSKFYFGRPLPIGMPETGPKPAALPLLSAVAPKFRNDVKSLNDTADPAATIRNAFTAQHDGNCVMLLAGPPSNLLRSLALPNVKQLATAKTRMLIVVDDAAFRSDASAAQKLLAEWPTPVVRCDQELGAQVPFPKDSFESDFAWATEGHPLLEAYRAAGSSADIPSPAMAAVLFAVRPGDKFFSVGDNSKLVADLSRKEEIQKAYRDFVSVKPVSRFPRRT
jgi:purine nucleosidase